MERKKPMGIGPLRTRLERCTRSSPIFKNTYMTVYRKYVVQEFKSSWIYYQIGWSCCISELLVWMFIFTWEHYPISIMLKRLSLWSSSLSLIKLTSPTDIKKVIWKRKRYSICAQILSLKHLNLAKKGHGSHVAKRSITLPGLAQQKLDSPKIQYTPHLPGKSKLKEQMIDRLRSWRTNKQ